MPTTLSSPAATGTLPCLQAIHMGVACPSAQRSYQRTGGGPGTHWLNLLLPQSAPTCASEWCGCTSSGDLECFFSVDPSQVLLQRGADGQMPPQVSAMGLVFFCRCVLLVNWTLCLYQLGGWHEFCQWQGTATFPVHQPSVAQFLWLVRQRFPNR